MSNSLDPEKRYPVAEVFPNIEVDGDLVREGESVEFAFLVFKLVGPDDSEAGWSYRTTAAPNREELLGALEIKIEALKRQITADAEFPE